MCRFLAEPLLLRGQDGVGCIHARKIAQTSAVLQSATNDACYFGFHSLARRSASATWSGVICSAAKSRAFDPFVAPCAKRG